MHLQCFPSILICVTVAPSSLSGFADIPTSSSFFPNLLLSVAPSITCVSASATIISMPLYTGILATTLEMLFCFISLRSLFGSIPTWIILVPSSFQVMAYIIFFPSAVFGVTSWHMVSDLFLSMGLKYSICAPESKL